MKDVWFERDLMQVELQDGRVVSVSFRAFPRLANASEAQRAKWEIIGRGVGIHWPELDEDLSTAGLLRDAVSVSQGRSEAS